MIIRPSRPQRDNKEIIRLIRTELIPLSHTANPNDKQTIRELPRRLSEGTTFVAANNKWSSPYGFVHLGVKKDSLFIDMLAVDASHQGKRIGQSLMKHAEDYGLKHKCNHAFLFVDEGNSRAHLFYTRLGYYSVKYYPNFRFFEMHKRLAAPLSNHLHRAF
ncbi:GNAT family N-acetyltransferase [Paenibacillus tarimensis]